MSESMRRIALLSLCLIVSYAIHPSSRTVYYLHTTPATWASARDTCARYEGHLVNVKNKVTLDADIDTLDNWLGWNGTYKRLGPNTDVWSGLYRFTDPRNGTETVMWHACEAFSSAISPNSNIATRLVASNVYCASMSSELTLHPTACDTKLPYICQIEEGQCWFLPVEGKSFSQIPPVTDNGDLNTCAKNCRNDIDQTGSECWGFTEKDGLCMLYRDSNRHAFIRNPVNYLQIDPEVTSYFKICTGGESTPMKPVTEDYSVKPAHASCTSEDSATDNWNSGVCYCDCDQPPIILPPEYLALPIDEKIGRIVRELKVNAKNTSASFRKLNSIDDSRPSAKSIGAAGIIILAVVFGGLVLLDLDVLVSHILHICGWRGGRAPERINRGPTK